MKVLLLFTKNLLSQTRYVCSVSVSVCLCRIENELYTRKSKRSIEMDLAHATLHPSNWGVFRVFTSSSTFYYCYYYCHHMAFWRWCLFTHEIPCTNTLPHDQYAHPLFACSRIRISFFQCSYDYYLLLLLLLFWNVNA